GLATGLGVDIGLCVALIGDRQLHLHGLTSHWGRALRVTTLAMSLVLNVSIALREGHYLSALMHAFLPLLLVVLTEYGQDVLVKFTTLARDNTAGQLPPAAQEPAAGSLARIGPGLVSSTTTTALSGAESSRGSASAAGWLPFSPGPALSGVPATPVASVSEPLPAPQPFASAGDELLARVRRLMAECPGQPPGRRAVARQLGITEHAARVVLDQLVTAGSPASNGAGRAKSPGDGRVSR
ncbi:MAG: hypothetical protein JO345_01535, partial [Streptosporangiaceae bacterium]|nr:hypothetical protein [Streptosporangiaceae bacterium]